LASFVRELERQRKLRPTISLKPLRHSTRGRQSLVDGIKNNICGKVTRELVPGTLQVDPIANYGAVELGVHRFHHPGNAEDVGEAQFVTLWQNKNGTWQITRAISFDHHAVAK
jgi:hypothetical protein